MNHRECFEYFECTPTNIRWSWTAKNVRTKTVVLTCWADGFANGVYRRIHTTSGHGYKELIRDIRYAQEHCDGILHVIMAKAKNPHEHPRKIEWCEPRDMQMKIISFNETTGELVAKPVEVLLAHTREAVTS